MSTAPVSLPTLPSPRVCPCCSSVDIVGCADWSARSEDPTDLDNTAALVEWQCRSCSASFWVGADVAPVSSVARETIRSFLLRVGCPVEALNLYRFPDLLDEPVGGLLEAFVEDVAAIQHALEHLDEPPAQIALWTAVLEQIRVQVFG